MPFRNSHFLHFYTSSSTKLSVNTPSLPSEIFGGVGIAWVPLLPNLGSWRVTDPGRLEDLEARKETRGRHLYTWGTLSHTFFTVFFSMLKVTGPFHWKWAGLIWVEHSLTLWESIISSQTQTPVNTLYLIKIYIKILNILFSIFFWFYKTESNISFLWYTWNRFYAHIYAIISEKTEHSEGRERQMLRNMDWFLNQ